MKKENIICFQRLNKMLVLVLVVGLLSSCAPEVEQAERDINSPIAGIVRLADQMHAHGDDDGAMDFYARAVQRAPDDPLGHAKLADLLEAHGMNIDAADQYRILNGLVPDNAEYRRAYGRTLVKLNRLPDAKEQYEAALKIDSSDIKSQNGLGVTLDLLGDHAGAGQIYKKALEEKPDDTVTLSNLGHSYIMAGAYDQAIQLLEPYYKNSTAPKALRENLAEAYGMSGMDVDAERVMQQDLQPPQIKKNLARIHAARAKSAPPPLYANLGSLSTSELAQARVDKIKEQFADVTGPLTFEIVTEMEEVGGTPTFNVRASGFKNRVDAEVFCKKLKKGDVFCKARAG